VEGIYKSGMRNLSLARHWCTDFVIFTSMFGGVRVTHLFSFLCWFCCWFIYLLPTVFSNVYLSHTCEFSSSVSVRIVWLFIDVNMFRKTKRSKQDSQNCLMLPMAE
jgi:hypothetical protein